MEPVIEFLMKLPLFSGVKKKMGTDLGTKLVFAYVLKSHHILRQGERDTNNLYILYKGTAEVECYSAKTGAMMTSGTVEPGYVLGTDAVVHHRRSITSVVAQSDCKLILIPRKLLEEFDILRVLEQSKSRAADGKERASTEFEKLIEHFFHAFDKDADGALSKEELFQLLKSLGFSYSQQEAQHALSEFRSSTENKEGHIDIHCFKDFWMSCNFIDPLNVQALNKEAEHGNLSATQGAEFYTPMYSQISSEMAAHEIESEVEKLMLQKASEARSIWLEYDAQSSLMDKVHIRMMLVDLRSEQCSAGAVERLLAQDLADVQRSRDGLIHFEDFVSWWMMHNAELYHAHVQAQEKHMRQRQRQRSFLSSPSASSVDSPTHAGPIVSPTPPSPFLRPAKSPSTCPAGSDQSSMDMSSNGQLLPEATRHHPNVELDEGCSLPCAQTYAAWF